MPRLNARAAEFAGLMRQLRWNQARTARELFVTAAHVNQIVNGKAEPSAAMVQLLKLTAARHQAGDAGVPLPDGSAPPPARDWLDEFWAEMRQRRLDRLGRADQVAFARSLACLLGVTWEGPAGKNPKPETRNPKEIRSPKSEGAKKNAP
jgi:transcriptional regulator with XRE-family HTH domain